MTSVRNHAPKLLRDWPLTSFILASYAITWLLMGAAVYLWQIEYHGEFQTWFLIFLPGAWGPSIAASLIVYVQEGRSGLTQLLRSIIDWRHKPVWYLAALMLPMTITGLSVLISTPNVLDLFNQIDLVAFLIGLPLYLALALPFGPIGEELGWRGFATPTLMQHFGSFSLCVVLGAIWTLWHLPFFWLPGAAFPDFQQVSVGSIAIYWLYLTGNCLIYHSIWLKTNGSVLLAILLHASFNATENIVLGPLPDRVWQSEAQIYYVGIAITWAIGAIMLFMCSREPTVRSRKASGR